MFFTALSYFFHCELALNTISCKAFCGWLEDARMHETAASAPTATEQRQLVQRILGSELFSKSHRLSAFLRFIFEQYSRGQSSTINEQRIGTEVFGRPPGYHVGEDSIVRSQARFLRQRLEEYFSGEGRQEALVLIIPKGSYVPAFEHRPVAEPPPPAEILIAENKAAVGTPGIGTVLVYRALLAAAICAVLALSVVLYRAPARPSAQSEVTAVKAFWTTLFSLDRTTLIVPADSTLVLMQELTGKPVRLHSYIDKDYINVKPPDHTPMWNMLVGSQYTSTADLNLVADLQRVPEAMRVRPQIRYARDLNLKDLKENNAILIGGLRANPWMELFSSSTNFDVDYDVTAHRNLVRNRAPAANERPVYIEDPPGTAGALAYGVVVYLPSLDRQDDSMEHSLLVEGTSKAGTEAAAEFLTSPAFGQFLQTIGATPKTVPNFELLLSTGVMDGASYHPQVVCWHLLHHRPNR
jgi:hypothetical protein